MKKLPECNLKAKSVHLRLLTQDDLPMTMTWRNADDTCQWFGKRKPVTWDEHFKWYCDYAARDNDFVFVIVDNKTDECIGQASIYDIEDDRAQFGRFIVCTDQRQRGYGYQVVHLLLKLAFESMDLQCVYLKTKVDNQRAFNLYHACGFIVSKWATDYIYMLKVRV